MPVLSSRKQSLYVFSHSIRTELLRPMGLHRGGETAKAVDSATTVDSVLIFGRLAEYTSFVKSGEDKHGTASSTMPATGSFCERVEINSLSEHGIFGYYRRGRAFLSDTRKPCVGPSRSSTRRQSACNEGGITVGLLSAWFSTVPSGCLYLRLFR